MIPAWILDLFAALMLVVAAVSAARLVAARLVTAEPWRHGARRAALADIDVAHLLMAVAMAGMLTASLRTLPNGAWSVIFAVLTVWFGSRVLRDARVSGVRALAGGHCAPHFIHAGAMLYMFVALTAPSARGSGGMGGGMSGMGTLRLPFLAFVFAFVLIGYSIWDLDQLSGPGASGHYSLAAARTPRPGPVLVGAGTSAAGAGAVAGLASAAIASEPVAEPAEAAEVPPASGPADGTGVLAPWVATGCRVAMGITMAFMLLILI